MSRVEQAIEAIRAAVSGSESEDRTAMSEAVDAEIFEDADVVTVPGERTLAHVSVRPAEHLTVGDLEEFLGRAHRLPREPSGGDRTVMFTDTLPREGEAGATVLAEVDEHDQVSRLIIRADSF